MDIADILGGGSPLGLTLQWILLTVVFLMLTYLFRNQIEVEGLTGWLLMLAVVMPINISAKNYIHYMDWPLSRQMIPVAYGTMILILNIILFLVMTILLPGLSVSNNIILIIFAVLFSAASALLAFLPDMFVNGTVNL